MKVNEGERKMRGDTVTMEKDHFGLAAVGKSSKTSAI